jgi:hypothetical protein
MKRAITAFLVLGLFVAGCATPEPSDPLPDDGAVDLGVLSLPDASRLRRLPARLVLLSIEGLTPDAYEAGPGGRVAPSDSAPAPTLAWLAREGVHADAVVPVVPAASYPAHATLVTGRRPDRHGIVADRVLGQKGVRSEYEWQASRLEGEVLWKLASRASLPVVSLGWPTTNGAGIPFLLPDIEPVRPGQSWLAVLAGATSTALWDRTSQLAPPGRRSDWPTASERDAVLTTLACELTTAPVVPVLWLLRFKQAGAAQQASGPGSPAADAALRAADSELERLMRCFANAGLLDTTAFVVVGDRRISPVHTEVRPNLALERAGLLTPPTRSAPDALTSWSALVRTSEEIGFLYAVDQESAILARKALHRQSLESGAFRIVSAKDLKTHHGDPRAWFGIEALPGYVMSDETEEPVLRASEQLGASGRMQAQAGGAVGFVAWGPGLRPGVRIPRLQQIDIAPTVGSLLGLEFRESEGRPMIGALLQGLVEE